MNNREDSEAPITLASKSSRLFDFELMRQLTHYGKRVMASVGLVIAIALVIVVGFLMVTDGGVLLHIDPQAFNVLAIMVVMPILCKVIVDMICIIKHGRLI